MSEVKMSNRFDKYVESCKLDGAQVVEKAAADNDDIIFAYINSGDTNFDKFAPLSTMDQAQYYKHLWKRTIAPLSVSFFLLVATIAIPYYNPDADLSFFTSWSKFVFLALVVSFFLIIFLNFRLQWNWFKKYGYDLDQSNKVYQEAVKTVGFGQKGIYVLTPHARDKANILRPDLIVNDDSYSDITEFKMDEDKNTVTLIIEGYDIKKIKIIDPETDYHDGLFEEVEALIANNKKT